MSSYTISGKSSDYGWSKTEDGKGVVVWKGDWFQVLDANLKMQFDDKTVDTSSLFDDGTSSDDNNDGNTNDNGTGDGATHKLSGNSSDWGWSTTEDGKGVVVWNDAGHQILDANVKMQFDDKTVDTSSLFDDGTSSGGTNDDTTDGDDSSGDGTVHKLTGSSSDWGWSKTEDGKGVVVWNDSDFEVLDANVKLQFDDKTVDTSYLFDGADPYEPPHEPKKEYIDVIGSKLHSTGFQIQVNASGSHASVWVNIDTNKILGDDAKIDKGSLKIDWSSFEQILEENSFGGVREYGVQEFYGTYKFHFYGETGGTYGGERAELIADLISKGLHLNATYTVDGWEKHVCLKVHIIEVPAYSPIALDLDGDGEIGVTGETTSKEKDADAELGRTVEFDLDADGELDTIEWFDGSGDGILVDMTKIAADGSIDGSALFGDQGGKYANGYEKLEALDADDDGMVSGAELEGLGLWIDDGDAVLEDGEMKTAKEAGIASVSTDMKLVLDADGKQLMQSTATTDDGKEILTEDVWFAGADEVEVEEDLQAMTDAMNKDPLLEDCIA